MVQDRVYLAVAGLNCFCFCFFSFYCYFQRVFVTVKPGGFISRMGKTHRSGRRKLFSVDLFRFWTFQVCYMFVFVFVFVNIPIMVDER
jgi:hypothetical protein